MARGVTLPHTSTRPLVEATDVTYRYPKSTHQALSDVTFRAFPGEVVALLGQNGSGKTTLVRHFNGLVTPERGSISVANLDARSATQHELSRACGYVFQNPSHQIFNGTVREELQFALRMFGDDAAHIARQVESVSGQFGLTSLLDTHPASLNYTQRKLLTIASVIAYEPHVLILDEPTAGMDEIGRGILSRAITSFITGERAVILISHDMDYVAQIAHRLVVMANGQVVGSGLPTEVFTDDDVLRLGHIHAPQISRLDRSLGFDGRPIALTPETFIEARRSTTVA